MSKSFYSKTFAQVSPIFFVLLLVVSFFGGKLRLEVIKPISQIQLQTAFLSKFGFSENFVINNANVFFMIELIISIAVIFTVFLLGRSLVGQTCGFFSATFIAFYPYFITNCYTTSVFFLLFFSLYLLFQITAISTMLKKYNIFAGAFFALCVITEPACVILFIFPYIYHIFKAKNIAVFYNFVFFLAGMIAMLIPFILIVLISHGKLSSIFPFASVFSTFHVGFTKFISSPLEYLTNNIIPFVKSDIARPANAFTLQGYSYLHYVVITLSCLGILYSFVEEKIRIIAILFFVIFLQALFMSLNFSYLFLPIVIIAGYMIDKVFNDVFC